MNKLNLNMFYSIIYIYQLARWFILSNISKFNLLTIFLLNNLLIIMHYESMRLLYIVKILLHVFPLFDKIHNMSLSGEGTT